MNETWKRFRQGAALLAGVSGTPIPTPKVGWEAPSSEYPKLTQAEANFLIGFEERSGQMAPVSHADIKMYEDLQKKALGISDGTKVVDGAEYENPYC